MSQQFNEQYKTEVNVETATGQYEVSFTGTKDGATVSSTVTGTLADDHTPASISSARDLFATAQAEANKILEG